MDYTQRLQAFRAKRLEILAKTSIQEADNKIARADNIELFLYRRALVEIEDNQRSFHFPKELLSAKEIRKNYETYF